MARINSTMEDNSKVYFTSKSVQPKNFIDNGLVLDMDLANMLSVNVSPGECDIAGKYHMLDETYNIALSPRSTSLVYAQHLAYSDYPSIGKVDAVLPTPDANTLLYYDFNDVFVDTDSKTKVRDKSGNNNHGIFTGTIAKVDGRFGYAYQPDDSTGYIQSTTSSGFPTGSAEREMSIVMTVMKTTGQQLVAGYGTDVNSTMFAVHLNGSRLQVAGYSNDYNTLFDVEVGETYNITVGHYNGISYATVNGRLIAAGAHSLNTALTVLNIGRSNSSLSPYTTNAVIHYVELRNKMRPAYTLSQVSNKMLFPCQYSKPTASYPTLRPSYLASAFHEFRMSDASGATVTDTAGTLHGTMTGGSIVPSHIGLGYARRFNGTSDYITCGNFQFSPTFTVVGVVRASSSAGYQNIMGNRSGSAMTSIRTSHNGSQKLGVATDNNAAVESDAVFPASTKAFLGVVATGGKVTFYVNSPTPDSTKTCAINSTVNAPLQIGQVGGTVASNYFSGDIDYLLYIPMALSQFEISQIYKALMSSEYTDVREILPIDSISLGRVLAGSSSVIDIQQTHGDGRRGKPTNKEVFLGYKLFNAVQVVQFDPTAVLRTSKYKIRVVYAEDSEGRNETPAAPLFQSGSTWFGYDFRRKPNGKLEVETEAGGLANLGTWRTSGYVGVYVEPIGGD